MEPAVLVVEAARLVDGHQHRQVVQPRKLEVLLAPAPGAMCTIPVPSSMLTSVHGITRARPRLPAPGCRTALRTAGRRAPLRQAALRTSRRDRGRPPPSRRSPPPVLGLGVNRRRDVRRQRPGCRRPDDERLARPLEQRQAHEKRRIGAVGSCRPARAPRSTYRSGGTTPSSDDRVGANLARGRSCRKRQMYSMFWSLKVK